MNKNALQPIPINVQMNSNSCRIVNQFYYVILRNERVVGSNPISGSNKKRLPRNRKLFLYHAPSDCLDRYNSDISFRISSMTAVLHTQFHPHPSSTLYAYGKKYYAVHIGDTIVDWR